MRFALAALVLFATGAVAAPDMRPGMWEITIHSEMTGVPAKIPPQTVRQCIKKEDVGDPKKTIPADKNCQVTDIQNSGNTTRWKLACKTEGGHMQGSGQITVNEQSYSGSGTMTTNMQGQSFSMKTTYAGKRVGDCR